MRTVLLPAEFVAEVRAALAEADAVRAAVAALVARYEAIERTFHELVPADLDDDARWEGPWVGSGAADLQERIGDLGALVAKIT